MKAKSSALLGMLGGVALGAVAVQGLHAQSKPPVYYITEIDVSNPEAYAKEYSPIAQATIEASCSATPSGTSATLSSSIATYSA